MICRVQRRSCDALLCECLGARRTMAFDRGPAWGGSMSAPAPGGTVEGAPGLRGVGFCAADAVAGTASS
jgi:predicted CxxxxCH...CXXCH cytochrome family protein